MRYDTSPAFDPDGKYLYFLGAREFYPVFDMVRFDYGFPKAMKPYLVTLRKDVPSPFVLEPRAIVARKKKQMPPPEAANGKNGSSSGKTSVGKIAVSDDKIASDPARAKGAQTLKNVYKNALTKAYKEILKSVEAGEKPKTEAQPPASLGAAGMTIDFDGIQDRILGFPVAEGRYGQIVGAENRALFTVHPVEGIKPNHSWYSEEHAGGALMAVRFRRSTRCRIAKGCRYNRDGIR